MVSLDGPVGRGGYQEQTAEQSLARLGSVPTHLMWVMQVLGLRWESQGHHSFHGKYPA